MIILVLVIAIIVGAIYIFKQNADPETTKKVVFDEKKIISKFNKLISAINPRNIETVKKELLECIDEYSAVKRQQFIEARTLITNSISSINTQINEIRNKMDEKTRNLRNSITKLSDYDGAHLCYEVDLYKSMLSKLQDSQGKLFEQLTKLDQKISYFETQLEVRRTQILTMISSSIAINDNSSIDLKLDSLEKEFKGEVNKIEQARIVDEKMGNTKKDDELSFDLEKYIKIFKEMK